MHRDHSSIHHCEINIKHESSDSPMMRRCMPSHSLYLFLLCMLNPDDEEVEHLFLLLLHMKLGVST